MIWVTGFFCTPLKVLYLIPTDSADEGWERQLWEGVGEQYLILAPRVWAGDMEPRWALHEFSNLSLVFSGHKKIVFYFLWEEDAIYLLSGPHGNTQLLCQCELFLRIPANGWEWTCSVAVFQRKRNVSWPSIWNWFGIVLDAYLNLTYHYFTSSSLAFIKCLGWPRFPHIRLVIIFNLFLSFASVGCQRFVMGEECNGTRNMYLERKEAL